MRLADRITQCRTPFVVQHTKDGTLTHLTGAATFANEIRACPTRYVLSDDLTRLCTALAYSKGTTTLACADLLHVPAERVWVEWCEAPWRAELARYGFMADAKPNIGGRRGAFIRHQLWVTPFDAEERYPAGAFVNQSRGEDGLPTWTARDRSVENTDIVLWHSFGLHHLQRPEDHPVQPCVVCGFRLMPVGFFDQNPVIDLPRETNAASRAAAGPASCCA